MKTNFVKGESRPVAFIAKSKQRVKQYGDTVYLKNGDEFQLELFNPTQAKVLARIELNNTSIGPGIILRPGERVFLDRYVNEARKFLFETYKVSGDNSEVQKAIESNGDVVVKFFKEVIEVPWNLSTNTYPFNQPLYNDYTTSNIKAFTNTTATRSFCNTSFSDSGAIFSGSACSYSSSSSIPVTDFLSMDTELKKGILDNSRNNILGKRSKLVKQSADKEIETGRVEKGSHSNQTFKADYSKFEYTHAWKSEWKLLPESRKEITADDLVQYCSSCGRKKRKNEKFCPSCGNKF